MVWFAVAAAWVATACAVAFAIYITGSALPLFAMVIPAMLEANDKP